LASLVDADRGRLLRQHVARLQQLATQGQRGESVEPLAAAIQASANHVLARSDGSLLGTREIDATLRALTAPDRTPSGHRGAPQTAGAVAALVSARKWQQPETGHPVPAKRGCALPPREKTSLEHAIDDMFDDLQSAANYDPARFAQDVAAVRRELDQGG